VKNGKWKVKCERIEVRSEKSNNQITRTERKVKCERIEVRSEKSNNQITRTERMEEM